MKNVVKVKESFKESLNKYSQPVHTYAKFTEGVGAGYDFTLFGLKLQNIKVSDVEDKSSEGWGPWKVGKFEAEIVPGAYDWEADHPYWYLSSKDSSYSYTIVDQVDVKGGKVSGEFETSAENIEDRLATEKHDLRDMIGGGWAHTNLPATLEMEKEDTDSRYKPIDMSEDNNESFIEKATIELDPTYVNNCIEYAIYGGADDDEGGYEADEEDWEEDEEEEDLEESKRHPDPDKWRVGDWVSYKGKKYITDMFLGGDMVRLVTHDDEITVPCSEVYKVSRKEVYGESKKHKRIMKESKAQDIKYLKYLLRKEEVTALDDEERWELQDLINKYGYPEEYDESKESKLRENLYDEVISFIDDYVFDKCKDSSYVDNYNMSRRIADYVYDKYEEDKIHDPGYLDSLIDDYHENPSKFDIFEDGSDLVDSIEYKGARINHWVDRQNKDDDWYTVNIIKHGWDAVWGVKDVEEGKKLIDERELRLGESKKSDGDKLNEDAYTSKIRQDVLAINAAKKQINDAVDSLDRKVTAVTNDIVQSANRRPVKPEVLVEAERYSHKLVLKSDDGNGTFRIRNEKNYRYKSEAEAQEDLDRLNKKFGSMLAGKKVHLEIEEIPKKPRKKANEDESFENPFKEGDVLVGDIGYNCELPVFYKVTKVTPKCVYARRLATKFKDTDGYGQVGYLTPNVDDMRGEAIRMMVKKAGHYEWEKKGTPDRYYVVLPDYSRNILNLWDGKPAYYNSMD